MPETFIEELFAVAISEDGLRADVLLGTEEQTKEPERHEKSAPSLADRIAADLEALAVQQSVAVRQAEQARLAAEKQREKERLALLEAVKSDEAVRYSAERVNAERQALIEAIRTGLTNDIADAVRYALPSPVVSQTPEMGGDGKLVRVVRTHEDGTVSTLSVRRDADGKVSDVVSE